MWAISGVMMSWDGTVLRLHPSLHMSMIISCGRTYHHWTGRQGINSSRLFIIWCKSSLWLHWAASGAGGMSSMLYANLKSPDPPLIQSMELNLKSVAFNLPGLQVRAPLGTPMPNLYSRYCWVLGSLPPTLPPSFFPSHLPSKGPSNGITYITVHGIRPIRAGVRINIC